MLLGTFFVCEKSISIQGGNPQELSVVRRFLEGQPEWIQNTWAGHPRDHHGLHNDFDSYPLSTKVNSPRKIANLRRVPKRLRPVRW